MCFFLLLCLVGPSAPTSASRSTGYQSPYCPCPLPLGGSERRPPSRVSRKQGNLQGILPRPHDRPRFRSRSPPCPCPRNREITGNSLRFIMMALRSVDRPNWPAPTLCNTIAEGARRIAAVPRFRAFLVCARIALHCSRKSQLGEDLLRQRLLFRLDLIVWK